MSKQLWLPSGEARAVVQIIHGMCEHIGRYDAFARVLANRGCAVFARDLPGHGTDCSTPGYAEGNMWEESLTVIREDFKALQGRFQNLPHIVFGHSYGSFLLQRLIPELTASAFILSGSNRQMDTEKLGKLLALAEALPPKQPADKLAELTFAAYNKPFEAEGTNAWLSRDLSRVAKYNADPYCGYVSSAAFYRGMYGGLLELCDPSFPPAASEPLPVLIFSGDRDPVGNFGAGVKELAALYTERGYDVTLKLYPNGRHEMLNELNRGQVISDILSFTHRFIKA